MLPGSHVMQRVRLTPRAGERQYQLKQPRTSSARSRSPSIRLLGTCRWSRGLICWLCFGPRGPDQCERRREAPLPYPEPDYAQVENARRTLELRSRSPGSVWPRCGGDTRGRPHPKPCGSGEPTRLRAAHDSWSRSASEAWSSQQAHAAHASARLRRSTSSRSLLRCSRSPHALLGVTESVTGVTAGRSEPP
jgi:hypothetical protein